MSHGPRASLGGQETLLLPLMAHPRLISVDKDVENVVGAVAHAVPGQHQPERPRPEQARHELEVVKKGVVSGARGSVGGEQRGVKGGRNEKEKERQTPNENRGQKGIAHSDIPS